jgi:hypothetical protein
MLNLLTICLTNLSFSRGNGKIDAFLTLLHLLAQFTAAQIDGHSTLLWHKWARPKQNSKDRFSAVWLADWSSELSSLRTIIFFVQI